MNTEKTKKPLSKRRKIAIIIIVVYFLLLGAEVMRSNTTIDVECFEYKSASVPKAFDGVKIVSVTDYHNHGGSYEDKLIGKIKEQSPDYIFLVGKKRTEPIYEGVISTGFDKTKVEAFDNLQDAMNRAMNIKTDKKKYILLENDLPDNY